MWADAQCFFQRVRQEGKDKGTSRVFSSNRCPQLVPGGPSESRVHKEASGKQPEEQGHKVVPTQRDSEGSTIPPSQCVHMVRRAQCMQQSWSVLARVFWWMCVMMGPSAAPTHPVETERVSATMDEFATFARE